jgi:Spy/CpxP family protein refolding chaperone
MTKLIALVAAGVFAAGTMFAGEHGDCTMQAGNKGKMACTVALTDLNLTPEQKSKMDALISEHLKEGCNKESEAKYMDGAKAILTKEQFTKFEAECCSAEKEKPTA